MKITNQLFIFACLGLFFTSCTKEMPVANFSFDGSTKRPPASIVFTNNSVNSESYLWDFGDGSTSTDVSPTHEFNQPGYYSVTLLAKNKAGNSSVMSKYLLISNPYSYASIGSLTIVPHFSGNNYRFEVNTGQVNYISLPQVVANTRYSLPIQSLYFVSLNESRTITMRYGPMNGEFFNPTGTPTSFVIKPSDYVSSTSGSAFPDKIMLQQNSNYDIELGIVWY
jgi:hypothetical protein